jgi:hypothetical protein
MSPFPLVSARDTDTWAAHMAVMACIPFCGDCRRKVSGEAAPHDHDVR